MVQALTSISVVIGDRRWSSLSAVLLLFLGIGAAVLSPASYGAADNHRQCSLGTPPLTWTTCLQTVQTALAAVRWLGWAWIKVRKYWAYMLVRLAVEAYS
jgi:hypothetical protein